MLELGIACIVTIVVAYLIVKKQKAQTVLIVGGLILMSCAILMGHPILDEKKTTGFVWFDLFKYIENMFSLRAAGMGLMIMAVGGFARYMDHIGASKVLVSMTIQPLKAMRSPYIVLAMTYIIGQLLNVFIPSASGLGVLLMVTIYPVLISLGISKVSATAVIGTVACLDLGPASGNAVLAAKTANLDVAIYFTQYQIPVAIVTAFTIAVLHFFVQRWFDRREGHQIIAKDMDESLVNKEAIPPKIYAILPIVPLVLILVFSKICIPTIKMTVVTAMLISTALAMLFELLRSHDLTKVFKSIQVFFDGMGKQFAVVVTLIVAGETFAYGLTKIGAIDAIINAAHHSGFGEVGMIIVMTGIITVSSIVMGSGNAPFFAFAALAPSVAAKMGIAPVLMLMPMQLASGIARSVSPITACIVAVCGVSGVSPVEVVKRTAIPMSGGLLVMVIACFAFN